MDEVEQAIVRTVLYASVFEFALRDDEVHRYLISDAPCSYEAIIEVLTTSACLDGYLYQQAGYVTLAEHPEWVEKRLRRDHLAEMLWESAWRYGTWLSRVPFVEMVALTGSLSVRNPRDIEDDFDYMLVTQPHRVWLARIFAVFIVRVARLWGRELCPNYVVASNRLLQTRQDIFVAHEIAQMVVIGGHDTYEAIFHENVWLWHYLPNAMPQNGHPDVCSRQWWGKRLLEVLFSGWLGDCLEAWEFQRKARRFQTSFSTVLGRENGESAITSQEVKGHFNEHGAVIKRRYEAYLTQYAIEDINIP